MELKIYHCKECGNVVVKAVDGTESLVCCGEEMELLNANTVDAAKEKHVPVVEKNGEELSVVVGSVEHPMEEEHYITNIFVQQGDKVQIAYLKPG
ncbi:MAG: desulfoferrodoxin, partial [Gallicola sp.]|nr:desulfoferrodoxin [Gallicola sp.]